MKPEFNEGCRQWDTSWLAREVSITDGDFTACSRAGLNNAELKFRRPILTEAQEVKFEAGQTHIIVHPKKTQANGKVSFQSPFYDIYCPRSPHDYKLAEDGRGKLLIGDPYRASAGEGWRILSALAPFPCCDRFSIDR